MSHHSGEAGPVLLLLHGLGATGEVWNNLIDIVGDGWPGPVLVPDLPGHGRSAALHTSPSTASRSSSPAADTTLTSKNHKHYNRFSTNC